MDRVECPVCNQEFDPSSQGGVCTNPDCGKWQYDPEDDSEHAADGEETDDEVVEDHDRKSDNEIPDEEMPETTYCPSCGELVPENNFCTNCSHEFGTVEETQQCLDCEETVPRLNYCINCAAGLQTIVEGADRCPSCDASVKSDENFCSTCGANLADVPRALVLDFMGEEFSVADGDVVGRHLRSAAHADGVEKHEALKISREHVEFDRTSDGFYLIDRATNDTYLNGERLSDGERQAVEPGDEIGFHNVGTATVRPA